ncbi:MAG: RNA 2',3'-cyclic phosphodiesterase [Acidobacteria bacterium]|nr:MAG: RNA 2',3'-cyclic phosphodiesterase [Acidobacteriota bacterium]
MTRIQKKPPPNWFAAFAIEPTAAMRAWLDTIAENAPLGVVFFKPMDLHITVAFFGALSSEQVPVLLQTIGKIAFSPFSIEFGETRALPSRKRFSALTLTLGKGRDKVTKMMGELESNLLALVGKRSRRSPLPHMTFARPKKRSDGEILSWLDQLNPPDCSVIIREITMYTRSDNRRQSLFKRVN